MLPDMNVGNGDIQAVGRIELLLHRLGDFVPADIFPATNRVHHQILVFRHVLCQGFQILLGIGANHRLQNGFRRFTNFQISGQQ